MKPRYVSQILLISALTVLCLIWIYPFLWLVSASLKGQLEIFSKGLNLIPETLQFGNYLRAWNDANFGLYMLNTVLVTVGTVVIVIVRCALTGYVLGRYDFIGKRFLIIVFVATFIVPAGYTIIPIVDLSQRLNLLNSLWGIILALGGAGQGGLDSTLRGLLSECAQRARRSRYRRRCQLFADLFQDYAATRGTCYSDCGSPDFFAGVELLFRSARLHL